MGKEEILLVLRAVLTAVLLSLAVYTDVKERKVLNKHTFPSALAGLVLCAAGSWKEALLRMAVIAVEVFSSVFGLMGMGDLKLLIALTAIWGFYPVLFTVLFACAVMVCYSLITNHREFCMAMINVKNRFFYKTPIPTEGKTRYPFAVFIASGFVITAGLQLAGRISAF